MGSNCFIKIYTDNLTHGRHILELAVQEVRRLNDKYSRYHPQSLVSQINQSAGTNNITVLDDEAMALMHYANTCFEQSEGVFDITSGALRKAWNFKNGLKPQTLPCPSLIKQLKKTIGWDKVYLKDQQFYLPVKGMEIDFGGIVKEYAADAVATLCEKNSINQGIVNLAGDLKVIGCASQQNTWHVLIQKPNAKDQYLAKPPIQQGAAATSGTYEKVTTINKKNYSHLMDPRTGHPIETNLASVTIIADSCVIAGSLSTIAMLKGNDGPAWLKQHIDLPFLCCYQNGQIISNQMPLI